MNQNERKALISQKFSECFNHPPTLWVQAPGRVDLMGSHTDYNEGYVLTMAIDRDTWIAAVDANMLTPIFLVKAVVDGMIERGFGRIVNITSSAVKAPIDILGLSNGARSGLTGFIAGVARKTVRHNVTINNLLPGPFDTERFHANVAVAAKNAGRPVEDVLAQRKAGNPAGRIGDPAEFGELCAYLCSAQAGFITGQNFLIDGGSYPGTF